MEKKTFKVLFITFIIAALLGMASCKLESKERAVIEPASAEYLIPVVEEMESGKPVAGEDVPADMPALSVGSGNFY